MTALEACPGVRAQRAELRIRFPSAAVLGEAVAAAGVACTSIGSAPAPGGCVDAVFRGPHRVQLAAALVEWVVEEEAAA